MQDQVRKTLKEECLIPENSRIVLAVSGGSDSVCLLDLLSKLPYKLSIAHLNHKLRPSADDEMAFVIKLAERYHVPIKWKVVDIKHLAFQKHTGIEETARKARYEFLFHTANLTKSVAVITAHHADDQIETVLMNFIRGAGMDGLAGMHYRSLTSFHPEIPLIRPLLDYWKEDILDYCSENQLEFREDESNKDTAYLRNKIRNALIPFLAEFNPNIKKTILRNQKIISEDWIYFQKKLEIAKRKINACKETHQIILSLEIFNSIELNLQRYLIRDWIHSLRPNFPDLNFDLIESARVSLNDIVHTRTLLLANSIYLLIENGKGIFTTDPMQVWRQNWPITQTGIRYPLDEGIIQIDPRWEMEIFFTTREIISDLYKENSDPFSAFLDLAFISEELVIRVWKDGDYYQPLGMGGKTIKLSDFWINKKIPKRARSKWPLVENLGRIIWIPGFQPSHDVRVTDSTTDILLLKLKRTAHSEG